MRAERRSMVPPRVAVIAYTDAAPPRVHGPLRRPCSYLRDGPLGKGRSYSRRAMGRGGRERAWLRGAQAGEVSDLEALFRRHWPHAYRAAYLVVHDAAAAEDIAQESFLAAVRNLDRFDRKRPFRPWLHRIVVNRAIDWSRARALRRETAQTESGDESDTGDLGNPFSQGVAAGL